MHNDATEALIWRHYDEVNRFEYKDEVDPIAAMEKYPPVRFYRENHVFRIGHFGGKIVTLTPKTELPTGSILHILDNFAYSEEEYSDLPHLEDSPFIDRESFRKFIYHVRGINTEGPCPINDKYIYRPAGLPTRLMKFRSQHGSRFRYPNNIEELPTKKEALVIVNHNPLFRTKLFGRLRFFRKFQIILASVLNTVHQMTKFDKQQFILIPWGPEVFDKQLFLRSRDKLTMATVRRPESAHYLFMMHLAHYMWDAATTSMLDKLPAEDLKQINLIIQHGDKYLFYNLQDLKDLNVKNRAYLRFINQLNMLSVLGRIDENTPKEVKEKVLQEFNTIKVDSEKDDTPADTPDVKTGFVEPGREIIAPIVTSVATVVDVDSASSVVEEDKDETATKIAKISQAVPVPQESKKEFTTTVSISLPEVNVDAGETDAIQQLNATSIKENTTSTENYVQDLIISQDRAAEEFIDKQDHLTPAAKNRYKTLAKKYKTLTIHGQKIDTLLSASTDLSLTQDDVAKDQVGEIPDTSALRSSLTKFDEAYMQKTYHQHLAGVLTSFQKNGVYLTDLQEEKQVTEMNNVTRYTCKFEDIHGAKSTIRFAMPTVDREGKVLIDGNKQVLKKQRINLPIVKISDTEISLASNMNKTRVIRNENKAHNFFSFVDSFINSAKSTAQIEFGKCDINLPIAYEYCAIAPRYKRITFSTAEGRYELFFNYNERLAHFADGRKPEACAAELRALEKQYGTYLGYTPKDYLFIDSHNRIYAISKRGGEDTEFPYTSMLDILKLSLVEGEKVNKNLSEWISIKILDKILPVMFLLSYRYGLRNTLDYLGVQYAITEGRSKVLVGESVKGQEDFDIDEDDYVWEDVDFDDLVGTEGWIWKIAYALLKPSLWLGKKLATLWDKFKPTGPRLYKIGIYGTQVKKGQIKIGTIALTIATSRTTMKQYRYDKFNGKVIERAKGTFVGKVAESIVTDLGIHPVDIAFAEWKNTAKGTLAKHASRLPVLDATTLKHIKGKESLKAMYYKQVAKHQKMNHIQGIEHFAYHTTKDIEPIKKYGLMSPRDLYETDRQLFRETSYQNYKERTQKFLNKNDVTDEDILKYLDEAPIRQPSSSRSIFWSFIPGSKMPYVSIGAYQLEVDLDTIKRHALNAPIIVRGPKMEYTTWEKIEAEWNEYCADAEENAQIPPGHKLSFRRIVHFCVDSRPIPFAEMTLTEPLIAQMEKTSKIDARSVVLGGTTPYDYLPVLDDKYVKDFWAKIIRNYKDIFDLDLSHLSFEFSAVPLYNDGRPFEGKLDHYGASCVFPDKVVINPNFREVWINTPDKGNGTIEEFNFTLVKLLAHEVAHHIYHPDPTNPLIDEVIQQAEEEGFTSWYADTYKGKSKYKEEYFCEYMAHICVRGTREKLGPISVFQEKVQHLDKLDALGFQDDEYFIYASGAAVLYGMPIENGDLDICATPEAIKRMGNKLKPGPKDGIHNYMFTDTSGHVDVARGDKEDWIHWDIYSHLTTKIGGYRYLTWDGLKKFYHDLFQRYGKEKHKSRLDWMNTIERQHDYSIPLEKLPVLTWQYAHQLYSVARNEYRKQFNFRLRDVRLEVVNNSTPDDSWVSYLKNDTIYVNAHASIALGRALETDTLNSITEFDQLVMFAIASAIAQSIYQEATDGYREDILMRANDEGLESPFRCAVDTTTTEVDAIRFCEFFATEICYKTDSKTEPVLEEKVIKTVTKVAEKEEEMDEGGTLAPISDAKRYVPQPNDIAVKFADRVLWINRYPLQHSLIVAGLEYFDLSGYELSAFEDKDIYYQLLQDKGLSTNYLKGIDDFFDLFIDNMTYYILRMMHEPTNVRDLLIRCAVLLSTTDYRPPSSRENHRIRGYEQFNAILYNELSRNLAAYKARRGKGNVFSIPPDAVFLRILQNASMVTSEAANPLQDVKETTYMTYAGVGGRSADSFVVEDRKFARDDLGVISEATVDNQKVAINASLSMDPGLENTMGILNPRPIDELEPANVLSMPALMFPFSSSDDSKRINFINTQSSHMVPTATVEKPRVRTGYERVLAHRVGRTFAGMAPQDGKVTDIDTKTKMIEVSYKDGTTDYYQYGEQYTEFQGFHVTQQIECAVTVGQKFKKGEVITYNKGYFTQDRDTGQLDFSTGVLANVVLLETDTTLEDSTEISTSLSEKLTIYPTNSRVVTLNKKSVIHSCVGIGDHVTHTDDLIVFEEEAIEGTTTFGNDEETLELLSDLNRRTPSAKFSGKIVSIEAYAGCDPSEMHPSLASIFKSATAIKAKRSRMAKGTLAEDDHPPVGILPVGSKYKGVYFDENTVCLIFYIQEAIANDKGDKIVFCNQLKCTTAGIFPHPIYSESGIEIDAFFSANAVERRIVMSPTIHGIMARCSEAIEAQALDIYFGDKK